VSRRKIRLIAHTVRAASRTLASTGLALACLATPALATAPVGLPLCGSSDPIRAASTLAGTSASRTATAGIRAAVTKIGSDQSASAALPAGLAAGFSASVSAIALDRVAWGLDFARRCSRIRGQPLSDGLA
jgi:hypothetical protein